MDKDLKARLRKRFGKGTLFEGKYRIKGHLGTGSFAYVMKAKHDMNKAIINNVRG